MDCVKRDIEMIRRDYERHELRRIDAKSALIMRPGFGSMWAEIILGESGTLIVHGDGPDMVFRSWRGGETLLGLARWAGDSGAGYIATKVAAGTPREYSGALARQEIEEHIQLIDMGDEPENRAMRDMLERPIWDDNQEHEMREALCDAVEDGCEWSLGMRPSIELLQAQEACRTLCRLAATMGSADGSGS